MNLLDAFRFRNDQLPTEYPFRQALKIYGRQFGIFLLVSALGLLLLIAIGLMLQNIGAIWTMIVLLGLSVGSGITFIVARTEAATITLDRHLFSEIPTAIGFAIGLLATVLLTLVLSDQSAIVLPASRPTNTPSSTNTPSRLMVPSTPTQSPTASELRVTMTSPQDGTDIPPDSDIPLRGRLSFSLPENHFLWIVVSDGEDLYPMDPIAVSSQGEWSSSIRLPAATWENKAVTVHFVLVDEDTSDFFDANRYVELEGGKLPDGAISLKQLSLEVKTPREENIPISCTLPNGEAVTAESLSRVIGGIAAHWTEGGHPCIWVYANQGVNASFRHPGGGTMITYWAGFPPPENADGCEIEEIEYNGGPTWTVRCPTAGATFEADQIGFHATPLPTGLQIVVAGVGFAREDLTPMQRERSALLAAELDAKRKLAAWQEGAESEAVTVVDQGVVQSDVIRQVVQAHLIGTRIVEQSYDDASRQATVELELILEEHSPLVTETPTGPPPVAPSCDDQEDVELLEEPWSLSAAGGNAAESPQPYQPIESLVLQGKDLLQVKLDLNGATFGGERKDESAIVIDQEGYWFVASVATHGVEHGKHGEQTIYIPLSDFERLNERGEPDGTRLDLSKPAGPLHARFWNRQDFVVEISSIVACKS